MLKAKEKATDKKQTLEVGTHPQERRWAVNPKTNLCKLRYERSVRDIDITYTVFQPKIINTRPMPGIFILSGNNIRISIPEFEFLQFDFQLPKGVAEKAAEIFGIAG